MAKSNQCLFTLLRPFHLTRAIAHAHVSTRVSTRVSTCVSTRANLSAHVMCRTHEKSYSAEKVLFIEYSSFDVYVYERHLWIMRYMSIAYRRRWLRRPNRKIGFVGFLCVGFHFRYFLRTAQAWTVYYFKCWISSFCINITNFEKSSIVPVIFCCDGGTL